LIIYFYITFRSGNWRAIFASSRRQISFHALGQIHLA